MQRPHVIEFSTLSVGCPTRNMRRQLMSKLILMDYDLLYRGALPEHPFLSKAQAADYSIKGTEFRCPVDAMLVIQQDPEFVSHFGAHKEPERNSIAHNIARYLAEAGVISIRFAAAA